MAKNEIGETHGGDDEVESERGFPARALEKCCERLAKTMKETRELETEVRGLREAFQAEEISVEQLESMRVAMKQAQVNVTRQTRRLREAKMYIGIQLEICDMLETPPEKIQQAFALANELRREGSNVCWLGDKKNGA